MTLAGKGVMAFWNDIAPGAEDDFNHWHVAEHIPERVGVPGFLRGRRYVAHDASPKYFNFYETESLATLTSPAYLARLNDPTPWTKRAIQTFRNSNRTLCRVIASLGRGEGGAMLTLRFAPAADAAARVRDRLAGELLATLVERPGVVGAHLLRGDAEASRAETEEKALRAAPDQIADWVLLVDAIEPETLAGLRAGDLADRVLSGHGLADIAAGIYRLHYSLRQEDLAGAG